MRVSKSTSEKRSFNLKPDTLYQFLYNTVILPVEARFARPKTVCFAYYSQSCDRWFGQANPAPTVDDSIGRFSFEHPLTVNKITVTPDFWYAFRQIFPPPSHLLSLSSVLFMAFYYLCAHQSTD